MSISHHKLHHKIVVDRIKFKPLCQKLAGAVKMLQVKVAQQNLYITRLQEELRNSRKRSAEADDINPICKRVKSNSPPEKKFSCQWCKAEGKTVEYGYLKNLKRHLLEHHKCNEPGNEKYRFDKNGIALVLPGETIYKYECLCCPKRFEEKRKLIKHMGLQHPNVDASAYKTQRKTPHKKFQLCNVHGRKIIKLVLT